MTRRHRQTPTHTPRATECELKHAWQNMLASILALAPNTVDRAGFVRAFWDDADKAARCYAAIVRSIDREREDRA